MSRLAVMAHFDVEGVVRPHVRGQIEALAASVSRLVVCSTARLRPEERAWLQERCDLVERANYGYDFFSYKVGLAHAGDLSGYDEVIVCNDSYVFAHDSYDPVFSAMAEREVDFWGLSGARRHAPHLQSFFVAFRPWVAQSHTFRTFWNTLEPISKRRQVIRRYEIGLSQSLYDAGFVSSTYFQETPHDKRVARRRVQWWATRRAPWPHGRTEWDALRERAAEPWNPAAAMADRILDSARLPYAKIDTLRYDPYGLDSDRLLTLCERAMPARFAGVRDYLEATAERYPLRDNERLHPAPALLRPLYPLVRYTDVG